MATKLTRTQADSHYAEINRYTAKRSHFNRVSAWKWLKKNHPEVAETIRVEGYRRWPLKPRRRGEYTRVDYSFLDDLEGQR